MGYSVSFIIVLVGCAVMIYFNYPPPVPSPLLKQWQDTGTYFTFEDYKIFFHDVKGLESDVTEKRTLLLIHGFPTSSLDWYKVLPDLRRRFDRIILPDLLGQGFSDKPKEFNYPVSFQADMIVALLAHLQQSEVDILAHDLGDTVAQELVARFIEHELEFNINSVALLNGGIFPSKHKPIIGQTLLRKPIIGSVLARLANFYFFRASIVSIFGTNKPTDEELNDMWVQQRYLDGYLVLPNILSYIDQRFKNSFRWVDALVEYSLKHPIHLIAGPADPINPLLCTNFKTMIPDGSCDVLSENISHFPLLEDPVRLVELYFAFIDRKQQ